ncbi:MAG: GNAT family N-acetyltransferase [Clostridia bacterium]|nr:GNAT family N-acetyltransferase [Clostridia bacterium]
MIEDKRLYDAFVDLSPQGCLFHKSWWLDAVAPGRYEILTVRNNSGIAAAWPVVFQRIMAVRVSLLPPLTPILGIMFGPDRKLKYAERLSEEMRLTAQLIKMLPKHAFFCQHFHHRFRSWLPLYWENFQETTRYTYVIEDLSDMDRVWANMRYNTKRKIQKAKKLGIKVVCDLGLDRLLDLNEMTFKRQGLSVPYSREYVKRIDEACAKQRARKMFFAVDKSGQLHAAVYIVYDQKTAYYLFGGGDPKLRSSNGHALVLWEAIKFASRVSKSFDFEGSMHGNIEPFFRGFGGVQKPYMEITRGNPLLKLAFRAAKSAWSKGGIPARLISKLLT